MTEDLSCQERLIRDQVRQSQTRLDGLEQRRNRAQARRDDLGGQKRQYDLLLQVVSSLEELEGLGAAELFWSHPQAGPSVSVAIIAQARRHVAEFSEHLAGAEAQLQSISAEIGDQNESLEVLSSELFDVMAEEESRRNEWLVERDAAVLPARMQVMPWARGCEEDRRFQRSLAGSLLASILVALLISLVDIPILTRSAVSEVPERVARLVREERKLPPPPPVEEAPIPEQEPPEPELAEAVTPEPEVSPAETDKPVVAQAEQPETREQVKSKGILAFRKSFADRANIRPAAQLGSSARMTNAGEDAVGRPQRSMVTTTAPGSSGGINLADISRDAGGGGGQGLEGVQIAQVASSIGGGEGAGVGRPLSGGGFAGRTDEEIQIVFDRYKAALYRLYNRELRKNPTLRGQLTLKLTIEPDGSVSLCELQSSNMGAPALAQQVVTRVRAFDFGAKDDISEVTIVYPIDFLPAA